MAEPVEQTTVDSWKANLSGDTSFDRGERLPSWWTGKQPQDIPGIGADGKLRSLPQPNTRVASREDLQTYFENTWGMNEVLLSGLVGEEAFYRPPKHELRHPKVFYLGHTASFYVNKFRVAGLTSKAIDPYFESIFEVGVDEMSWDDLNKNLMMWPAVSDIVEYRREVFNMVSDVIARHGAFESLAAAERPQDSPFWAVVMGMEHERIHLETSSVLIRELPLHLVQKPSVWPGLHPSVPSGEAVTDRPVAGEHYPLNPMVTVPAGDAVLGKERAFPTFGWDNEYGSLSAHVPQFDASRYQVSNGEFLEFVRDGGYGRRSLWSDDGWRWRAFRNAKWPHFWESQGPSGLHQYKLRTIFEEVEMPWDWPADVNFHEASAFARWRSERSGTTTRVLTELEHVRLRADSDPTQPAVRGGDGALEPATDLAATQGGEAMAAQSLNLNLAWGGPGPVGMGPEAASGARGVFGNAWEWCEDHFSGLPGFETHEYYQDFSTPCFDGEHNMMLGGSFISTGNEASSFARFSFRPHFFQHAGFRVVQPSDPALVKTCAHSEGPTVQGTPCCELPLAADEGAKYMDPAVVGQYMALHFGGSDGASGAGGGAIPPSFLDFPARCARALMAAADSVDAPTGRALDLGCGTGGSTFRLAERYGGGSGDGSGDGSVVGIDLSAAFIAAAEQLRADGSMEYSVATEGALTQRLVAEVPGDIDASRVAFETGDALNLRPDLGSFDALLVGNLLCRLPNPQVLLRQLPELVNPGGVLMITSPFTWREGFTPKEHWLGGRVDGTEVVHSRDTLLSSLSDNFTLLSESDMPLVIREHARKYELIVAHAGIWQRKTE